MSKSNGRVEEAAFDFSRVSMRWGKAFRTNGSDIGKIALKLDEITDGDEQAALDLLEEMEHLLDNRFALIAKVLVDVPRTWLDPDAPDDLDWSDPEAQGWILEDSYKKLIDAVNERRSSKN